MTSARQDWCSRAPRRSQSRSLCAGGFTLIELLVAIVVIGILSGLVLGALAKASTRSKAMKTQATIIKLHQQVMSKWESYKYRRPPIDPKLLLTGPSCPQQTNAINFIGALWANRGSQANDPLSPTAPGFPTTAQISAVRLLAMRELQRYEMPSCYGDIIGFDPSTSTLVGAPGSYVPRTPQILLTVPQLAQAYVQRLNFACAQHPGITDAQVREHETAECLYMIVKLACEEENNEIADSMKEIGDFDGDGMQEFQDAFTGMDQKYPTAAATNNPIAFCRWPAGFTNLNRADGSGNFIDSLHFSDYQDDPLNLIEEGPSGSLGSLQVISGANATATFAADNHDYFDPLKLDMPTGATQPRGFQLTPLIYSAGPDSIYGITLSGWIDPAYSASVQGVLINDPYAPNSAGTEYSGQWHAGGTLAPQAGTLDNITNHISNAR